MAETTTKTGEHPVTNGELKRALSLNDVKLVAVAITVAVGTAFGAYRVVLGEAKAQTDAGVQVLERRLTTVEQRQQQQAADIHEVQVDIRALYRTITTGERSARLERPPAAVDGGR